MHYYYIYKYIKHISHSAECVNQILQDKVFDDSVMDMILYKYK